MLFAAGCAASAHNTPGRDAREPFRKAPRVVMPDADHLPHHAAFRRIEIDAQVIAAALMRERNPHEVVPVVLDAGIRFERDVIEIAVESGGFSDWSS
ncbi:hypothetical protein [Burkholderia sp. F1]|uniref:hypothetical protein n=1 Tax=Burkholderia sp. F1 TaxID=3366817 RepID=UPI003D710650